MNNMQSMLRTMAKSLAAAAFAMALLLNSNTAQAYSTCTGKVTAVSVSADGSVFLNLSGAGVNIADSVICNVNTNLTIGMGTLTKETCVQMFGLAHAAFLSGRNVTLFSSNSTQTMCTAPSWSLLYNSTYNFYHLKAL